MPYKIPICGIYKIVNLATGQCYVGQSQRIQKRLKEHFRRLRLNKHKNQHLQRSYNLYGPDSFVGSIEVEVQDWTELDQLEEAFLQKEAWFEEPNTYNIADFAKAPMRGRFHSEETRKKIRLGRRATTFDYQGAEYRKRLSDAHMARIRADPKYMAKIQFIVENNHLSYAERGRKTGTSTSSTRRLFLKYQPLIESMPWHKPDSQAR